MFLRKKDCLILEMYAFDETFLSLDVGSKLLVNKEKISEIISYNKYSLILSKTLDEIKKSSIWQFEK